MDTTDVIVCGEPYKIRKLSAYEAKKLIGPGLKDLADIDVDLLLVAVVEPKLKRADVLALAFQEEKYFALVEAAENVNRTVLEALGNSLMRGLRPSKQKSTENSNSTSSPRNSTSP